MEGLVAITVGTVTVAALLPIAVRQFFDEGKVPDVLRIQSGDTYTLESTDTESYEGVVWEDTGSLVFEGSSSLIIQEV